MMHPFLKEELWPVLEKTHDGSCERHVTPNSVFTTYYAKLNLLSFQKGKIRKKVRIIGLPPSISLEGYHLKNDQGMNEMINWLKGQSGHTLVINSEERLSGCFSCVPTLPSVIFENTFESFEHYLNELRSHYRYRAIKALKKFESVEQKQNETFDSALYDLYDAVYQNSEYPLAKNEMVFFERFPGTIEQFYIGEKPIGFCQYHIAEGTLYFMFCGINYEELKTYDTYMNMLLIIIRRGIEAGVKIIDLGQTTETIKQKLGGTLKPLYICHFHKNRVIRSLMKRAMPMLGYALPKTRYHVFKNEGDRS